QSPTADTVSKNDTGSTANSSNKTEGTDLDNQILPIATLDRLHFPSPSDMAEPGLPNMVPTGQDQEAFGLSLEPARSSSLSVREIAVQNETPGIMAPTQNDIFLQDDFAEIRGAKLKQKPDPPKARRWRGRHVKEEDEAGGKSMDEESEARTKQA